MGDVCPTDMGQVSGYKTNRQAAKRNKLKTAKIFCSLFSLSNSPLFFLPSLAEWEVTLSPIKKQKKMWRDRNDTVPLPCAADSFPPTCKIPTPHGTDPLLTSYPLLPFSFVFISLADDDLASTCPFALSRLSIRCGSRWQTVVTKRREEKTGSAAFICLFRL